MEKTPAELRFVEKLMVRFGTEELEAQVYNLSLSIYRNSKTSFSSISLRDSEEAPCYAASIVVVRLESWENYFMRG